MRPLPSPLDVVRGGWRRLRTMRTAIVLLLFLAAGAAAGSALPQRPVDPGAVSRWASRNPGWAPVAEHLGMFDVFGAWWFMAIYGLLLVSLIGCLLPRYRALGRVLRARPDPSAAFERQQWYVSGRVGASPEAALSSAERVLRRKRFRMARAGGTIAAEKGYLREAGSLLFHTSFLVLLVGMSVGKLFGFSGQVAVVEGERFSETHVSYDSITEGRWFGERHRGFTVVLDRFDVDWYENGVPRRFASTVRVVEGERVVRSAVVEVNHPLSREGVNVFQLAWGWAPQIRVSQRGRVLYDGPTVLLPESGTWGGAVKVPGVKPLQMGLDLAFFADPEILSGGSVREASPRPRNPVVVFEEYRGDLRLDRAQSVYRLDMSGLAPAGRGIVRPGETVALADGVEVSFISLGQYSVFQVASNPGAPVLLGAVVLMMAGLIPSLYGSRRRVWVRVDARDGAAKIEIAGQALQRSAAFETEFAAFLRDLDRDLHVHLEIHDG